MHTLVCISWCRLTCGGGYLVHVRALAFGLARTQTHTQTHTHTLEYIVMTVYKCETHLLDNFGSLASVLYALQC